MASELSDSRFLIHQVAVVVINSVWCKIISGYDSFKQKEKQPGSSGKPDKRYAEIYRRNREGAIGNPQYET